MIGKTPRVHQMTFHEVALESFIDMNHELVQLSKAIDWAEVESEFSGYYCSDNGRPGVPIRKVVGLMLLKNIYDLSAKEVVARWMENPYMQYFTGCCICYTYNHSVSSTEGFADTLVKSIEGGLGMEEAIEAVVLTCEESSPE